MCRSPHEGKKIDVRLHLQRATRAMRAPSKLNTTTPKSVCSGGSPLHSESHKSSLHVRPSYTLGCTSSIIIVFISSPLMRSLLMAKGPCLLASKARRPPGGSAVSQRNNTTPNMTPQVREKIINSGPSPLKTGQRPQLLSSASSFMASLFTLITTQHLQITFVLSVLIWHDVQRC